MGGYHSIILQLIILTITIDFNYRMIKVTYFGNILIHFLGYQTKYEAMIPNYQNLFPKLVPQYMVGW